ncbi:endonuclease I [Kipferlia bialata]|uniref:Endonuclease I n=1 Tax=Kipferlia bialata TaxID=797122 RepID=A0A9K3CS88_9EUKA|nr:endonuclease I [Kipferlia bialata]|eukprot:g1614.t1
MRIVFVCALLACALCLYDGLSGAELRAALREDTYVGKHHTLGYSTARKKMYGYIDNIDGYVYGIYTDLALKYKHGSSDTSQNKDLNCEHIVPQSFFNKQDPMRSDVHHLRPAYDVANSARNHYTFEEVDDALAYKWFNQKTVATKTPSDPENWSRLMEDESAWGEHAWEPRDENQGTVARAILYFYTMYDQYICLDNKPCIEEMWKIGDVNMLIQWSADHPPSDWDRTRNEGAEKYQGNRNPFVDSPELVERAFEDMI